MNLNTTVSYISVLMVRRLVPENHRLHKRSEQGPVVFGRSPVSLSLYNRPDVFQEVVLLATRCRRDGRLQNVVWCSHATTVGGGAGRAWMGGRNKLGEMVEIKRRGFQLTATRSDSLYC